MTYLQRVWGAALLRPQAYEDVESDKAAMGQAVATVVLASLAAGIGLAGRGLGQLIFGAFAALVGWFLWAYVIYFIGARIFPEPQTKADHGELLRTLGFAASPGLLRLVGALPILPDALVNLILFLVSLWMLAATVVAARQALDYRSTGRAIMVCVIGWFLQAAVFAAVVLLAPTSLR